MPEISSSNDLKEKKNTLIQETVMEEKEPNLGFFSDNKTNQKKKKKRKSRKTPLKPYHTTRIRAWNFLKNISYNGVTNKDFFNRNFDFDRYVLLTKNMNLFSLERKIHDIHDLGWMHFNKILQGHMLQWKFYILTWWKCVTYSDKGNSLKIYWRKC